MPKRFLVLFFVIFTFLLFAFYFSFSASGATWIIQTVDSTGRVGDNSSIALESGTNYPHIAYRDDTNKDLKYAKWTGSTWEIQTVPDPDDVVGHSPSIALDSNNYPHIVYRDATNNRLKYARWTGGPPWEIQPVGPSDSGWGQPSIALDSNDRPHISYRDDANQDLKYAKWTGSSWTWEAVDTAGNVGMFSSIALESGTNYPHISYMDYTNGNIKHAKLTASGWTTEAVDYVESERGFSSIALDKNNRPHISYFDNATKHLKYANWTGSFWNKQAADGNDYVGHYTSIALDSNDYPHISYMDYGNQDLKYAKWTASGWTTEAVDHVGQESETSMALDSSNCPHISYYYATDSDLRYAVFDSASPTVTVEYPNGGEKIKGGSVKNITWVPATDNVGLKPSPITIKYSTNEGASWALITQEAANTGAYSWAIPTINTTQARISIEAEDLAGNIGADISNANFTIDSALPTVTVKSPNGGEKWAGGSTHYITWEASDNVGLRISPPPITIRYSTSGGTLWNLITSEVDNTGIYFWNVPYVNTILARVSVEAVDLAGNVSTDASNANFTIDSTPPTVTNVIAAQESTGKVIISYDISDNLQPQTTISFQYWDGATTAECLTTAGEGTVLNGTGKIGTWEAKTDFNGNYLVNCKIYVTSNDGVGNIGTGESAPFDLDTKDPTNVGCFSPLNGATNIAIHPALEAKAASDDNPIQYRFQLNITNNFGSPLQDSFYQASNIWNPATLSYSTAYYWRVRVKDAKGNETIGTSATFETLAGDDKPPVIKNVKFDGRAYVPGDIISPTPVITAVITDPSSVDATYNLKLYLTNISLTIECTTAYGGTPLTYEVTAKPIQAIPPGKYDMKIIGKDLAVPTSNEAEGWSGAVEVKAGAVQTVGTVLAYPVPFKPLRGQTLTIAYNLSTNADITIYMYSVSGEIVKTWKFRSGENGGKAGYNGIEWNGLTDFGGTIANGMYVYKIISRGKVIGSGKIVVFD